ncbi:MAG: alpha/beta hydrolase [Hyphomonadaceae bacterium]|jgi:pimeloyl-ACP methyl ester carboxylesterase|nr:alpha/beta hydrolase [Hyphomonadaceae bacterium]
MQTWNDIHFSARDGLRLYARHYPAAGSTRRPALCLAGLTRNARDFHDLATALAAAEETGREVYALDSRGRGRSERDRDWNNYSLLVELNDALDFMTMKGLNDAAIIGTSRGGLLAMMMAVLRPTAMGAVVLNDIGPVVERDGLARIVAYVGRIPLPKDWKEAADLVREMNRRQFTAVPDAQWSDFARAWFNDDNGLPAPGYDPEIARALSFTEGPAPELWPQFGALARVPVLAIRGENSDLLSAKTLAEMRARHPRLTTLTVRGQGHAPLLKDAPTIRAVAEFLAQTDTQAHSQRQPVPALA